MNDAALTVSGSCGGVVLVLCVCSASTVAADLSSVLRPVVVNGEYTQVLCPAKTLAQTAKPETVGAIVEICPECQQGDVPKGGGLGTPKCVPAVASWAAAVKELDVEKYIKEKWSAGSWDVAGRFVRHDALTLNIFLTEGILHATNLRTVADWNRVALVAGMPLMFREVPIEGDACGGGLKTGK